MPARTALVPLCAAAVLTACAPYVYTQEIAGFRSGVDTVAASYEAGRQAIDTAAAQRRDAALVASRTRLLLLPGCDQVAAAGTPPALPDCAIVSLGTTAPPPPDAVQRALAGAAPAFDALKAYAAALSAITAATDDATLNQATQGLATAAGGLAAAVAKAAPASATATRVVTPAGIVLGQGTALYLDARRCLALRGTVPAADAAVQALGQVAALALADIRKQELLRLGATMRRAGEPLEQASAGRLSLAEYRADLAALESAVAAFTQMRAADPAAAITAMMTAHRQLAQALLTATGQDAALVTVVQQFQAAAGQLGTAIAAAAAARMPARPQTAPRR